MSHVAWNCSTTSDSCFSQWCVWNDMFDFDQIIQSIRSCDFTTYLDYDVTHAVMIMQELFAAFVKQFVWVVQTEFALSKQKSNYRKHIFFLTEW